MTDPRAETLTAAETLTVLRRKGRAFVHVVITPDDAAVIEAKKGDLIDNVIAYLRDAYQAEGEPLWFYVVWHPEGVHVHPSEGPGRG